jgi:hypothetical protein
MEILKEVSRVMLHDAARRLMRSALTVLHVRDVLVGKSTDAVLSQRNQLRTGTENWLVMMMLAV